VPSTLIVSGIEVLHALRYTTGLNKTAYLLW